MTDNPRLNAKEKAEFITGLISTVKDSMLARIYDLPDNWGVYELRLYIRGKFAKVVWPDSVDGRQALNRQYEKDIKRKALL